MPIYEFRCNNCGHKFSTLCKVGEKVVCPQCGGETQRLFSTFAIFSESKSSEKSSGTSSPCASCSLTSCDTCKL
ncbi:zinc ribbon domain-containing protein [bacterium]|nr:zinc ribbon domain-containing protein [bacterium]